MNQSKKASLAAAICFLALLLLDVVQKELSNALRLSLPSLWYWAFLLTMAILLLPDRLTAGLPIAAGLNLVRVLYGARNTWRVLGLYPDVNKLHILCNLLSALALFLALLLALSSDPTLRKTVGAAWFVPGLLLALRYVPVWLTYDYAAVGMIGALVSVLSQAFHLAAFLLTCLWLKQLLREQEPLAEE